MELIKGDILRVRAYPTVVESRGTALGLIKSENLVPGASMCVKYCLDGNMKNAYKPDNIAMLVGVMSQSGILEMSSSATFAVGDGRVSLNGTEMPASEALRLIDNIGVTPTGASDIIENTIDKLDRADYSDAANKIMGTSGDARDPRVILADAYAIRREIGSILGTDAGFGEYPDKIRELKENHE